MSITFGTAFITVTQNWTAFKAIVSTKALPVQYDDDGNVYSIFAVDSAIIYLTTLFKDQVPTSPGFDQATNDTNRADFESNFKNNANKPLDTVLSMTGTVGGGLVGFYGAYLPTTTTALQAVRASLFTEQTFPCRRSFSSTNATDNASGSGAQQIRLTYYDGNMNGPYIEDLFLSGTTVVNTVNTNIQFVESIRSMLVGNNGGNAGNINMFATSSGAGGLIAQIPADDGKTYYAHHYVRPGCVFALKRLFSNTTAAAGNLSIRYINPLITGSFENQVGTAFRIMQGREILDFDDSLQIQGPCRVTIYVKPDATTPSTFYVNFGWEEF